MRFVFISFLYFLCFSSFIHSVELEELSYGYHVKQKIDFYPGSSDKVLVWIHGGGWIFSGKEKQDGLDDLKDILRLMKN